MVVNLWFYRCADCEVFSRMGGALLYRMVRFLARRMLYVCALESLFGFLVLFRYLGGQMGRIQRHIGQVRSALEENTRQVCFSPAARSTAPPNATAP